MEPKKTFGVGASAATNSQLYDRGIPATRRMMQRTRDSVSLRRQSRMSLDSEPRSSTSVSCVTRQASENDCARQRFIVWAAVRRNRSVRMAPSDRLRCPLLRCGEQFDDHETMLRHLTDCPHFASGEYVCYECMKVERFNDGRCKCCLGHPTKRRRIINMAKNFFSTLGHKSRKNGSFEIDPEEFPIPPPSYDSLDIEGPSEPQSDLEMGGTEILELDAGPVFPCQLDSVNYEQQRVGLRLMEQNSNSPSAMVATVMNSANTSHNFGQLQNHNGSRPSLVLNTQNLGPPRKVPRTKYLTPSSSLRSTNSSQGIISPTSADSGAWTNGSTIDTTRASPITPFSPSDDSGSLSRENSCKFPKDYPMGHSTNSSWVEADKTVLDPEVSPIESNSNYILDNLSELPGDDPLNAPRLWEQDPALFSFVPKDDYTWNSTVDTEVNVLFASDNLPSELNSQQDEHVVCGTKTLVGTTWDALKEHTTCSLANVEHIDNPLARRLRSLSAMDIALRGLSTLKSILNGVDPTDALDYLCFVHIIYAFSVIVHEDDVASRCDTLYQQALTYRGFLTSGEYDDYCMIVAAIWLPTERGEPEVPSVSSVSRSSSLKGKDLEPGLNSRAPARADPLVVVAQNFLDNIEMSVIRSVDRPIEILSSDLWSTYLSETNPGTLSSPDAFAITVNYIIQILSRNFETRDGFSDLISKLKFVRQQISAGYTTTARRLELELLQAGKNSMPPSVLFDEFIPQVRELCDPIYSQPCFNPRSKYHTLGVALVDTLIRTFDNTPVNVDTESFGTSNATSFPLNIPDHLDPLDEFLEDFDKTFINGEFITLADPPVGRTVGASLEENAEPITAGQHITVDPSSLSRINSSSQLSNMHSEAQTETIDIPAPSGSSYELAQSAASPSEAGTSSSGQKTEANSCCEICGYRPKGDPQWFKGSMAKHRKLQHSTDPPRVYKCPYPGCTSAYKNRPDNLRQHQIEKRHFVEGADGKIRRPSKRKKPVD